MDKRIFLFGAGTNGQKIQKLISERCDVQLMFCDNSTEKQNTLIQGISVVNFHEMCKYYANNKVDKIVITVMAEKEMLHQCALAGIDIKFIYYWDVASESLRPIYDKYSFQIYSIDGEEMFLRAFFGEKRDGVYIDVGANHPWRFSNTFWAYSRGWKGINIEPDVRNYELLSGIRSRDVNLNCGVSDVETSMDYYIFEESALNTFCYDEIENKNEIIDIRKVPIRRLDAILEEYDISEIDFMDIDVEGMELEVLKSIDWNKVNISCIIVEQRRMSIFDVVKSSVCRFLSDRGYIPVSKYNRTVIYTKSI
mgnify:CR=1 FL=1